MGALGTLSHGLRHDHCAFPYSEGRCYCRARWTDAIAVANETSYGAHAPHLCVRSGDSAVAARRVGENVLDDSG